MYSFIGGVLIGFGALILMLFNGRIMGVSGILGSLIDRPPPKDMVWRIVFVLGIFVFGLIASICLSDDLSSKLFGNRSSDVNSTWLLAISGFLVGFGTRLGSGCTSGHGVCGISRLSLRSMVATLCFIGSGMLVVYLVKLF